MNRLSLLLLPAVLTGCAASVTPNYDARFGTALRNALAMQVINPDAGRNGDAATGMDGTASRASIVLYQGTFKEPPPVVNVINIGGGVGGK